MKDYRFNNKTLLISYKIFKFLKTFKIKKFVNICFKLLFKFIKHKILTKTLNKI